MKYAPILIGLVVFSLFVTFIFTSASLLGDDYDSDDKTEYSDLAAGYDDYIEEGSKSDGTIRKIQNKTSTGSNPISAGSDIITAAIDGVRLFFGSITTTGQLTDKVIEDSGGRIHPLFGVAIKSILTIVILLIVIAMLMRKNPEA